MKLSIEHVSKNYGKKRALTDFSAELEPGIYGVLGPNGAGKSTLMNIITDNLLPDAGQVLWKGKDIRTLGGAYRARLGFMPQQQGLYDSFTGRRFLWYMAALKGIDHRTAKKQIHELLQIVNMEKSASEKISSYSGGMKQRLLLAQALLGNPSLLILDEPTAGLDPRERIRIRNFISEIARDKIVLFATHVVSDIEFIARQIIVIREGRLLYKAPIPTLLGIVDGKVYEATVDHSVATELQRKYRISNLRQQASGTSVRFVADIPPAGFDTKLVSPTLEDLYIYLFEEINQ